MPTYEYQCHQCQRTFAVEQRITEPALTECPRCRAPIQRLISGGGALIIKGHSSSNGADQSCAASECCLTQTGSTCCGRQQRCDQPSCGPKG